MKSTILLLLSFFISIALSAQPNGYYYNGNHYGDEPGYRNYNREKIQIALVLDVSGSMDGLIDQAKSQLWHIVGGVMMSDDFGYDPIIEIGLYELGNQNLGYRSQYMRQVVPFTSDLDWLSEELFHLRTGGRYEYYGQVIDLAVEQLDWSPRQRDLKLMYIAGNESFNQGRVSYRDAIRQANRRGIIVNTIYCGTYSKGIGYGWRDAAEYGGGDYMNIDHNYHIHYEPTHYDHTFGTLNRRLNSTYIPYGAHGQRYFQRQREQDRNAEQYGPVHQSQRTLVKASSSYRNDDWDLIDAIEAGRVRLADVPAQDLPPEMRQMSIRQKEAFVEGKRQERMKVQEEIRTLSRKKETDTRENRPSSPSKSDAPAKVETKTLDKAIIESVKKRQIEKQNLPQRPTSRNMEKKVEPVKKTEPVKQPEVRPQSRTEAGTETRTETVKQQPVSPRQAGSRKTDVTIEPEKPAEKPAEEVKKTDSRLPSAVQQRMSRKELMSKTIRR